MGPARARAPCRQAGPLLTALSAVLFSFWFSLDVLNDEKTRKWIQSMKRLMTFCQNKYLPDDLAKTAGWIKK